jgi:hypothetical protein
MVAIAELFSVQKKQLVEPSTQNSGSGNKPPIKHIADDAHDDGRLTPQERERLVSKNLSTQMEFILFDKSSSSSQTAKSVEIFLRGIQR